MASLLIAPVSLAALTGCDPHIDMGRQQRHNPHDESEFYADGSSARQLPAGTIPRDGIAQLPLANVGQAIPLAMNRETIDRGQQQFTIFCAACHGQLGNGEGMIVQRGFPRPPSYHIDRLKNAPDSHLYNVISQGYGAMYNFSDRIPPEDRWAIVAYVRTLQAVDDKVAPDVKAALVGQGDRIGGTSGGPK